MRRRSVTNTVIPRRGLAASELAVILPLLVFLFVLAVDFGRVFYFEFIVINAARCGALHGSTDANHAADSAGIALKARAEASNLDPLLLQVASTTGTDSAGNPCIDVTVSYPFRMITTYLTSSNLNVSARIRMRVGPMLPVTN
jgi:Flp pilus assembly protein TadG